MKTVCKENNCNGCMLCVNSCPKKAIQIKDNISSLNAVISEDLCVDCSKCITLCPQNNDVSMNAPILWKQGWASDKKIREKSSSGGLATAIALSFFKEGGSCVSCSFSKGDFMFSLAKSEEDIFSFRGSKYVKSNPIHAYELVKHEIEKNKKVLFIGLPCQVAGIKKYIGDSEFLYTIDLICHGSPSEKLLQMFLNKYTDLSLANSVSFRDKTKFNMAIDGCQLSRSGSRDFYMRYFLKKLFYTENCYDCHFAKLERCSDLTLGDSWGSELPSEEVQKGISLALCNTTKGCSLIEDASLHLEEVDLEKAIQANTNLASPSSKPKEREKFFRMIHKKNNFAYAIRKCFPKYYYKYLIKELFVRK